MRLSKFLIIIVFITCLCLLYVYQQTEIFRFAYMGQKKNIRLDELLDKNSILRYNIDSNSSVVNLADKLSANADFQIPENFRLVRVASSEASLKLREASNGKPALLSRIFSIKRQAEAKTINP
jgi:hypothetical protein